MEVPEIDHSNLALPFINNNEYKTDNLAPYKPLESLREA